MRHPLQVSLTWISTRVVSLTLHESCLTYSPRELSDLEGARDVYGGAGSRDEGERRDAAGGEALRWDSGSRIQRSGLSG